MSRFKSKKEAQIKQAIESYNLDQSDKAFQSTEVTVYDSFDEILSILEEEKRNRLLKSIFNYGFREPSDIQGKIIRPILEGRDVIGSAQSGTGKTGAFSIGIFGRIDENMDYIQAMIVSPTRELAQQTYNVMKNIGKDFRVSLFVGGDKKDESISILSDYKPQIVIGTIGRLADLLKNKDMNIGKLKILCLDEADELVKPNEKQESLSLVDIFDYVPNSEPKVQLILITATVSKLLLEAIDPVVVDPVKIIISGEQLVLDGIDQYSIEIDRNKKLDFIINLFSKAPITKLMLFVNSKKTLDFLLKNLSEKNQHHPLAIHSYLKNDERRSIMRQFKEDERCKILISTDLLAKGIDIQQVTMVINYEIPTSPDFYLHRIGRSGRFGRGGIAINIVSSEQERESLNNFYELYNIKDRKLGDDIYEIVTEKFQ